MKKILCMSLALLLVAGCSTKPKPEATPEVTPDTTNPATPNETKATAMVCGVNSSNETITSTFKLENGKITSLEQSITYAIDADTDVESLKKSLEDDKATMSSEKGITYNIEETEKEIMTTITYDLNEVSETILTTLGLTEDMKVDGSFDASKVREFMISNNAMCQEF
ncbi:hypothetical protein [Anaerorhabdus furcosa]|uniref:DUF1307 domain-containing protein n=1 Tax=Anaerorhabdus furcosa TaxID=118967 RepID=A0A1T4QD28_9FIRM|nr:hypothetical protein [Anaerorhabdus furcosa]SKA01138.1 hypothetical protein SAMN02745191_2393 [Anaerorhabdus furcosa]